MKIGLDIMGGDYAPKESVIGAALACKELPSEDRIILIGDENIAKEILSKENFDSSKFDFIHTTEIIEMGDHPAKAFQKKKNSSITIGFDLLGKGAIDGFASAGNTGAMLVGTMFVIKQTPGIIRPCIAAAIPQLKGGKAIVLDVGLNADCKPDVLYQYGKIGSIYATEVFGIKTPRVGLLSIGSEKEKGSLLSKATYEIMDGSDEFNFCGNVEGYDFFTGNKADVFVCDGFVGNVALKLAESFYSINKKLNMEHDFYEQLNFENFGGTPVLGVNSNVIIGHGASNAKAIKNMVLQTKKVIEAALPEKFKKAFH